VAKAAAGSPLEIGCRAKSSELGSLLTERPVFSSLAEKPHMTKITPIDWIASQTAGGHFIEAVGSGFGDYILSASEWKSLRISVLDRDGSLCVYCGSEANTVDHVIPKSLGGLTVERNLVAACRSCNSSKGGRL
jgi:HNH endonuclease